MKHMMVTRLKEQAEGSDHDDDDDDDDDEQVQ